MKKLNFFVLLITLLSTSIVKADALKDLLLLLDTPHGLNRLSEKNTTTLKHINAQPSKYIEILAQRYDAPMLNELIQSEETKETRRLESAILILTQINSEEAFAQLNQWYTELHGPDARKLRRTLLASIGTRPYNELIDNILVDLPEMDAGTFFAAYEYLWHAAQQTPSLKNKLKQLTEQTQLPEYQTQYLNKIIDNTVTN
ncbi:MAG: hypothetical protein KBT63_07915 [Porticoccaceae bacterium]|nr:hypothetical protein [Porticoccaceae bacterium]